MKRLLLAAFCQGFLITSQAQNRAEASIAATIVTPINIAKTSDMSFGNITTKTTSGTVTLAPAGSRTTTNGAFLPLLRNRFGGFF